MYDIEPYRRIEFFLKDLIEAAKNRGGGGGPTPGPTPPEPPTPEPPDPNADVLFYDYDGTITNSYTATEFAALTAMPDNPTHQGLTAQGWNWSLADAKDYVSKYGMLDIGQMYITDDGKTLIYIHLTEGRTSPMLGLGVNGSVVVDWGDGSTETLTGSSVDTTVYTGNHAYAAAGDYVITLTVTGSAKFRGNYLLRNSTTYSDAINKVYCGNITAIELGSGILIGNYAFGNAGATYITIPSSITSFDEGSFALCPNLKTVTVPAAFSGYLQYMVAKSSESLEIVSLPKGLKSTSGEIFSECTSLKRICLPPSLRDLFYSALYGCTSLKSAVIPKTTASLTLQSGVFQNCTSLTSITIPDSVSTIQANAFAGCTAMASVRFSGSTPPTVSNSSAWANLPTDCIIYVPSGSLTAYTTATNYPDPTTYQYVEY